MNTASLPIVIEQDKDGYFACCPSLQGCVTEGETYEEARENIEDAIKLYLEDMVVPIHTRKTLHPKIVKEALELIAEIQGSTEKE